MTSPVLLTICWVLCVSASSLSTKKFFNLGLNDKLFNDNIIFDFPAVSKLKCAFRCSQTESCLTYTIYSKSCRGHAVRVKSSSVSTAVPGARSFQRDWRYNLCTRKSDCGVSKTVTCFKGKCLCKVGYFYSVGKGKCVKTCGELQSTYTLYPGSGIKRMDAKRIDDATEAVCKAACNIDPMCLNYELTRTLQCHLHHETATQETWRPDNEEWFTSFYQRDCA